MENILLCIMHCVDGKYFIVYHALCKHLMCPVKKPQILMSKTHLSSNVRVFCTSNDSNNKLSRPTSQEDDSRKFSYAELPLAQRI